jgi:hypothetical protein
MKNTRTLLSCLSLLLAFVTRVSGQGTFRNLNFEEANLVNPPAPATPTFVAFADAYPGWTGYVSTNQTGQAMLNGVSGGTALMSLVTPNTATGGIYFGSSNDVISGTFTAVLAAGEFNGLVPVAIAQTGLVPLTSLSLRFSLGSHSYVSDLLVTLNGQEIPFFPLSTGTNYTLYGSDISAFAGLTGELRYTEQPISWPFAKAWLDDIFFSDQPIPEPSVLGLFALGALLLGWRFVRGKFRAGPAERNCG